MVGCAGNGLSSREKFELEWNGENHGQGVYELGQ
jgi:hypothetical protein